MANLLSPSAESRPQLEAAEAVRYQVANYLAQGAMPWQPVEVDAARWPADFVVAPDGSGTHRTVQAAVDAVPARTADPNLQRTWVIRIRPGIYRGPLCVRDKAPLRLVGEPGQAQAVTLVDSRYAGLPKEPGAAAQPCLPPQPSDRHGTSGSATAVVASPDVLLAHLTIANDATAQRVPVEDGAQAVALLTLADRIQLEDVRLISHQDTFYVKLPALQAPARVFVRRSLIAGDIDFVFGNATLVITDSTLLSRSDRPRGESSGVGKPSSAGGIVLAPSTPVDTALGFLVVNSRFMADADLPPGSVALGRAWDEGVPAGTWRPGVSPNGQVVVRNSELGQHIGGWTASTSRRPFTAPSRAADAAPSSPSSGTPSEPTPGNANRMAEFRNCLLPQAIAQALLAHEILAREPVGAKVLSSGDIQSPK